MTHHLIPSVEKRISAWTEIQRNRKEQDLAGQPPKLTITISRQFGCEGYPLVAALESKLRKKTGQEWVIFDNQFVDTLVKDREISKHLVKSFGDRAKYLDYIIASLLPSWKSEAEAFRLMVEAIYAIAQQGNAIILERGAFAITRELPNCFNFRLVAPLDYRIQSYARRTGISKQDAASFIEEKERDRERFLSDFLNCSFDQESFHLIFNNAKFPIEKIADNILYFLEI